MKNVIITFILISSLQCLAQEKPVRANIFLRVFDLKGTKIDAGKLSFISDSIVQIIRNKKVIAIPMKDIGFIKTKRSGGHNVIVGAGIGAGIFGIAGAASAEPNKSIVGYTAAEGAFIGTIFGGISGAVIGGASSMFKNPKRFEINGDPEKWKVFMYEMTRMK